MPRETAIHRRANDVSAGREPTVLGRYTSGWAAAQALDPLADAAIVKALSTEMATLGTPRMS